MCYLLSVLNLPRAYKKTQAVDCKIRGCGVDKKNEDTFEMLAIFNQSSRDVNKTSLLPPFHLFRWGEKKFTLEWMLKRQWILPCMTSIRILFLTNISEASLPTNQCKVTSSNLTNNQTRYTILFKYLFISLLYMFRSFKYPSSGENRCIYATLVFVTLDGWRLVCWLDSNPTSRPDATHPE